MDIGELRLPWMRILLGLVITIHCPDLFSQGEYSGKNLPILRYTANDAPLNFKYDLLKNTKKTILYSIKSLR